jgi:hypothetical protein
MKSDIMEAIWFYIFLCASSFLDICLLTVSSDYRNLLGAVDGSGIAIKILRYIPGTVLTVYYSIFFLKVRGVGAIPYRMIVIHSAVYVFLGATLLLPWIGILLAPLTPIGSLYLLFIMSVKNGYYYAVGLTAVFVALNIYFLARKQRIASALGV